MPEIVTNFEKQSRKRQNFRAARALSDISVIRVATHTIEKLFLKKLPLDFSLKSRKIWGNPKIPENPQNPPHLGCGNSD